jgi:hypothetical protein
VLDFINEENELWQRLPRLRGNALRRRRTLVNRAKKIFKNGNPPAAWKQNGYLEYLFLP